MRSKVVSNRTYWHSGLLFILLLVCKVGNAVQIQVLENGAVTSLKNGENFSVESVEYVGVICQNENGNVEWSLNGLSLPEKTQNIQIKSELLTAPKNKLECFVSNSDDFATSSYAVVYLLKGYEVADELGEVHLQVVEGDEVLREGERFILECSFEFAKNDFNASPEYENHVEAPSIHWMKNAKILDVTKSQNFDLKVISETRQQLVLDSVGPGDGATYGCLVSGSTSLYEEKSLYVKFVPKLGGPTSSQVSANATELVEFSCEIAAAFPHVGDVVWSKDGQPMLCNDEQFCSIGQRERKSTLKLKSASPSSVGNYTCTASNEIGTASKNFSLIVFHESPNITDITVKSENLFKISEKKIVVLEGQPDVEIHCQASGWPSPKVSFHIGSEEYPSSIKLDPALREKHEGVWKCAAKNQYGEIAEDSIEVLVASRTVIAEPDSDHVQTHLDDILRLECDFNVSDLFKESTKLSWTYNGKLLSFDSKRFETLVNDSEPVGGVYECRVETPLDSASRKFEVEVVQSPFVVPTFSSKMAVLKGGFVKLPCYSSGIPNPLTKWELNSNVTLNDVKDHRDLEPVPVDVKSVDLVIELVSDETSGYYNCFAENDHGKASLGVFVKAVNSTEPAAGFVNETLISKRAGDSLEIECNVSVDPVLGEFGAVRRFWEKDGKLLDEFGDKLTIPYLIGSSHAGTYSCIVDTPVDRVILVQKVKVLTAAPSIEKFPGNSGLASKSDYFILRGSNFSVSCNISRGIPFPQISWKKTSMDKVDESVAFSPTSGLTLYDVSPSDEGEYTCLAVNEYGNDKKSFRLNVLNHTTIHSRQDETHADTFTDVRFKCEPVVDKRLVANISWIRNGVKLEFTGPELLLQSVTKKDDGHYTCVAKTDYDTSNTTFRLAVTGESPTFIATEKDVRALEGSNVTVSCQANGLPIPKISWYKEGSPLVDRRFSIGPLGDLTMTSLSLSDAGEFLCRAENVYGMIETVSNVEILKRADSGSRDSGNAVIKNVGDNATLICDVTFDPRLRGETRVRWFFKSDAKGSSVTPVFADPSKFTSTKTKSKFETKENLLKIQDLKIDDKGVYECLVETPFEKITYSINLFVNGEAPKILSEFKKRNLYEGETLELRCLVRGSPRPTLRWLFNDRPLPDNAIEELETASPSEFRESRIKIESVSKKDDGVYQCETSNLYGSGVAKFAKITVIGRTFVRVGSSSADPEKEIVVHAGEKLKIPCKSEVDQANRITNITWSKDDGPMGVTSEDRIDFGMDGSITIANVQKRHSGVYRCTVTTVLDSANDSVPVRVVVNAPVITSKSPSKQIIFDGESLALLCNANGIPEPKITWMFNKTRSSVIGSEFLINKAIQSDTGEYVCEAKNPYGQTRHVMEVEVILMPMLPSETYVDKGSTTDLSCVLDQRYDVEVTWQRDFKEIDDGSVVIHANGSLTIQNVTEDSSGIYTCTVATLQGPGTRKRTLQTSVKLRPTIISTLSGTVSVIEGSDTSMSCHTVPGIEAKRLWRFNGVFLSTDSHKDLRQRGERLEIRGARLSDSGNYSCIAIAANGERDTVHFELRVIPRPQMETARNFSDCSSKPLIIKSIYRIDNSSVQVEWSDNGLDRSCFEKVSLIWWTNASESSSGTSEYSEKSVELSEKKIVITVSSFSDVIVEIYFVQANLVGPLNVQVYGETRSFVVADLDPVPEVVLPDESTNSDLLLLPHGSVATTVVAAVLGVLVLLVVLLTCGLVLYRRKYSKNPEPLESVCMWRREHCAEFCSWSSRSSQSSSTRYGKTNFNGFDRGAGPIIISSPMPVMGTTVTEVPEEDDPDDDEFENGLQRHSRFSVYRGSAYLAGALKNPPSLVHQSTVDFSAPQWPEPEEPVSASLANIYTSAPLHEREPFLAPKRSSRSTRSPQKRRGSKDSISSSWGSLFNVPAGSPATSPARETLSSFASTSVAIRPKSGTPPVLNSSSDPPPQVTSFMSHKPKNV